MTRPGYGRRWTLRRAHKASRCSASGSATSNVSGVPRTPEGCVCVACPVMLSPTATLFGRWSRDEEHRLSRAGHASLAVHTGVHVIWSSTSRMVAPPGVAVSTGLLLLFRTLKRRKDTSVHLCLTHICTCRNGFLRSGDWSKNRGCQTHLQHTCGFSLYRSADCNVHPPKAVAGQRASGSPLQTGFQGSS